MAIYNHVKSSLEPCGTFRETRRWENIVPSEITQKPPLCGLTFLTVDRLREREKAELTKGSGIVLSIESLSDSRAPKAVSRVVAYSASPSVIRSHLRAWGMISRSSPSISALADFPTPRVSLVSTSKGRPALSRSNGPIVDPGPVADRSPGRRRRLLCSHADIYVKTCRVSHGTAEWDAHRPRHRILSRGSQPQVSASQGLVPRGSLPQGSAIDVTVQYTTS